MTLLQKKLLRQSEIRQAINSLLGNDDRTEEQDSELATLTAEGTSIEPEIRAAIVAEPDPQTTITAANDPETRERLELRGKTGLADFLAAAAGGREVVGAAKEYAASVGCSPLNRIPLDIFTAGQPDARTRLQGTEGYRNVERWNVSDSDLCVECTGDYSRPLQWGRSGQGDTHRHGACQ